MTDRNSPYAELERALLAQVGTAPQGPGPIFILGSPRTGSTFLYQAMAAGFELPYIANLTNDHFADVPVLGFSVQAAWPSFEGLLAESRFGKISGALQPSEGSALMRRWFGGGHPSEVVSRDFLPGQEAHMAATMAGAERLFKRPLLIKNAWNCFRIAALARAFPRAAFIWIRRDVAASAASDLRARYVVQRDPTSWNSATPRNVEALRKRPYWEQVVENQVEYARAISEAFAGLPRGAFAAVWYEDLCQSPSESLARLARRLDALRGLELHRLLRVHAAEGDADLPAEDSTRLRAYLASAGARLEPHRYPGRLKEHYA